MYGGIILDTNTFTYRTNSRTFEVASKLKDYGYLARLNIEGLKAGKRIDIGEKKNKTDFSLWKFSSPNEKRQQEWDSPWGVGFPGWHSECVVMADTLLHAPFDIHTGGKDHIQVHHTNEIAQFKADTGKSMANYWLHSYFLTVDSTKMSKSQGTFLTLDDLVNKGYSPLDFRLLVLMAHYRSDLDFSWDSLHQAKQTRQRIIDFLNRVHTIKPHRRNLIIQKHIRDTYYNFRKALYNDLDSPKAIAHIFDFIKIVNTAIDNNQPIPRRHIIKLFQRVECVLAIDLPLRKVEIPAQISALFEQRNQARLNKNFAEADRIRTVLLQQGYTIQDRDGTSIILKTR
jgi:cysteinyl-tRNA synthetase